MCQKMNFVELPFEYMYLFWQLLYITDPNSPKNDAVFRYNLQYIPLFRSNIDSLA